LFDQPASGANPPNAAFTTTTLAWRSKNVSNEIEKLEKSANRKKTYGQQGCQILLATWEKVCQITIKYTK
jgi:hypothetical protein